MSSKTTGKELVEILSKVLQMPESKTKKILKAISNTIAEELQKGFNVNLPGIGIIKLRQKPAGVTKNALTDYKPVAYQAKTVVSLKIDKKLKDKLN